MILRKINFDIIWYSVKFVATLYLTIFVWSSDFLSFAFMNVVILVYSVYYEIYLCICVFVYMTAKLYSRPMLQTFQLFHLEIQWYNSKCTEYTECILYWINNFHAFSDLQLLTMKKANQLFKCVDIIFSSCYLFFDFHSRFSLFIHKSLFS